ncbi:MAG TPA: anaerobic ribonucleoside-triphosphate reductase activating protein [Alphaproteobacteria bacterium]|nr:anaerobic ribonucleoside-triphosphate reductase activating protein [Alphaproteobacteria bacterium]HNS44414.1 anaerobic ribonucleoside-triphosphate reductase activating protein [Alphaproteobacteria bacterium]
MLNESPVYSLTPFTMLDFPQKTACVVWFAGCNMRCAYCHNPEIVTGAGAKTTEDILDFLDTRRGLLDGVVISGGEATCYKELPAFLKQIKQKNFDVKLDSNGTNPAMIRDLFENNLVDYLALDYKASPCRFKNVTGTGRRMWDRFKETLGFLCKYQQGKFEIRTTIHTGLMGEGDIAQIISDLEEKQYQGTYYLQNYRHHDNGTLGHLPDQNNTIDIAAIPSPQNFTLEFRNF